MLHNLKWAYLGFCLSVFVFLTIPGTVVLALERHPVEHNIDSIVRAKSALLVEAGTGEILFQRNIEEHLPPASTIKMLTALLVYETKGLGGSVRASAEDKAEPSNVPLVPGETIAVRDLVYALLLGSDNDSALALARYTGGSTNNFINMMNNKAAALGCRNSFFKNPNGLPVNGQYTCTEDLMKIFEAFVNVPELRRISSTKNFFLKTAARSQTLKNHNKLLGVYPGMGPGKTGWTYASRHTYAAAVMRNGRELHLTILDSANKWNDASALFDYGFAHLPNLAAPAAIAPTPISTPAPAPPTSADTVRPSAQTHIIRPGETLTSIARTYDCSLAQLTQANQTLNPRLLKPGQKLLIPQ